jgi:penicillin-binding protein 1A
MSRARSVGASNTKRARPAFVAGFVGSTVLLSLALFFAFVYWLRLEDLPKSTLPEIDGARAGIYIFDRHDNLVTELHGSEDRVPVHLKSVSSLMRKAMLAAEDHRFYEHHGIDFEGVLRALATNLRLGRPVEGASTITQQLAKMLFFNDEGRTLERKLKILVVTWELEMCYSKDRILEAYLNEAYFGNGAYGIERAANVYFGKKPSQLDLSEAAFLAALVNAPSELGAPKNRGLAIRRQREILKNMAEYGFVTKTAAETARNEPLKLKRIDNSPRYPYYISYVVELLKQRFGDKDLWNRGLHVYTCMDETAEREAEQTLSKRMKRAPAGVSQAALVSISNQDGGVLALVGGVGDYWQHQWNRAISPHTAGSAFKPFVYLAALDDHVIGPDSVVDDSPVVIQQASGPDYCPKDFDNHFLGLMPVRKALALSRNLCAVRLAMATGMPKVIWTAHQAGISSKLDNYISLALGSAAVTPLEMAGAYSTLARGGVAIKPRVIRRIDDATGKTIAVSDPEEQRVFPVEPTAQLVDAMQDVVRYGTGTQARLADRPVAGKTGTADRARDIWFVGFTPDVTTAVWAGNDENQAIAGSNVTGGTVMAGCWHDYMQSYYAAHPTPFGEFTAPQQPLMHDIDAQGTALAPIRDALEDLIGGKSEPAKVLKSIEKPKGVIRRMFRALTNWL